MSDKPYYEQEYHAPESDIPDPSVGEIFKGLFLYPFTWAARSTRKAFWVAFVIQFLLTIVIGVISVAVFIPNGVLSVSRNDMSWVLTQKGFITRTPRGRSVTQKAYLQLGYPPKDEK